jgi:UDP-N-acetylglucosamine 2-epimerase (non-hydrolysing)
MTVTPHHSVIIVVGTRPEAIKLVPVIRALHRSERFIPFVITTGQHRDLVRDVLDKAGIRPDAELQLDRENGSLNELVAVLVQEFDQVVRSAFMMREEPEIDAARMRLGSLPVGVLVHGDTTSAFACALAAFHLQLPVLHMEAGLRAGRSNLTPFPEELNRRLIGEIAAMHFAPSEAAEENLVRQGISASQIMVTGNTAVDSILWAASLDVPSGIPELEALLASDARLVVVTAHRRENWNGGLARIGRAVQRLADAFPDVHFVAPLHPNPIVQRELGTLLFGRDNVTTMPALAYWSFARLIARAELIISDSGGIQEEAPSLDTPVFVTRSSTERMEGVDAGCIKVVGTDTDHIYHAVAHVLADSEALQGMITAHNPYGDGRAAERIVGSLANMADADAEPPTSFGPGYDRLRVLEAANLPVPGSVANIDDLLDAELAGLIPLGFDTPPSQGGLVEEHVGEQPATE